MKLTFTSALTNILSALPFPFFSIYLDFTYRSMSGYLVMMIALTSFLILSVKRRTPLLLFNGSVLSTIILLILNQSMANTEGWPTYSKPFSSSTLILTIFVIGLFSQFLFYFFLVESKKKDEQVIELKSHLASF